MSKRLLNKRAGNNPLHAAALAAGLILCAALSPTSAEAVEPLVMGPLYEEPERDADNPAPPSANGCAVQIAEFTDARRAPETVGAFASFRVMQAPPDREAWLRSVFEVGLAARGFTPSFVAAGETPTAAPGVVVVNVRIQGIWVTTVAMNKTGSVVFRAAVVSGGTPGDPQIYRGDKISMNMWGSRNEFNGLLNQLFANALDDLATDLQAQCAPAATPAAQ